MNKDDKFSGPMGDEDSLWEDDGREFKSKNYHIGPVIFLAVLAALIALYLKFSGVTLSDARVVYLKGDAEAALSVLSDYDKSSDPDIYSSYQLRVEIYSDKHSNAFDKSAAFRARMKLFDLGKNEDLAIDIMNDADVLGVPNHKIKDVLEYLGKKRNDVAITKLIDVYLESNNRREVTKGLSLLESQPPSIKRNIILGDYVLADTTSLSVLKRASGLYDEASKMGSPIAQMKLAFVQLSLSKADPINTDSYKRNFPIMVSKSIIMGYPSDGELLNEAYKILLLGKGVNVDKALAENIKKLIDENK